MSVDLHQILASKRAFRRELASRDILAKLALLDALRERTLSLRGDRFSNASNAGSTAVREDPMPHRTRPD